MTHQLAPLAAALTLAVTLLPSPATAGDGKTFKSINVVEEERKLWDASLSTGWDSL
jgi:hypothetical protein